jgi:hypothetical protein
MTFITKKTPCLKPRTATINVGVMIMFILFLTSFASATTFTRSVDYENNDLTAVFTNWWGLGGEQGRMTLTSHELDEKNEIKTLQVGLGKQIVMTYDFEFNEKLTDVLNDVTYTDMRTGRLIDREWSYVYLTTETKERNICIKEIEDEKNKTQMICAEYKIEEYSENVWKPYNLKELPNGKITIGIEVDVKQGDYIDGVWNIGSKSIDRHATWSYNETLNNNSADYWTFYRSNNNGNLSWDSINGLGAIVTSWNGINFARNGTNNRFPLNYSAVIKISNFTSIYTEGSLNLGMMVNDTDSRDEIIQNGISLIIGTNYVRIEQQDGGNTTKVGTNQVLANFSTTNSPDTFYNFSMNRTGWVMTFYKDGNLLGSATINGTSLQGNITANKTFHTGFGTSSRDGDDTYLKSLYIVDNNPLPEVTLTSPTEFQKLTDKDLTFDCKATNDFKVQNITLYLNNSVNGTNTSVFNNTATTFTRSLADGYYSWNCGACDNATTPQCANGTARYFWIDTTPPTILVTSGNGTQNYGDISTNHTLNITFTDTNLDNCWINYNGTNQTFDCTSGVDSPVNFTLQYNLYNATIWANDTFGNENSSFVSWDYRVFETNRTFSNETLSGSIEDFSINVTLGNETEIVSAIFVYNGTNTSSVITSIGNFRLITIDDFEIPIFSSTENISFYWEILLSDGTNFSTYTSTHLVSVLKLDNCSTYTFQLANISLFDEETLQLIRGDIEVYYSILNKPNYNSIKNLSGIFENISNTLICSDINLSNQNLAYSTEIRYSSEKGLFDDVGYAKEFYHIQRADIGELITISLYDLHLNETTEFEIEYQNEDLVKVANAIVQLQRKYIAEDIYRVVEAPITSNEGTAVLHIDLNTNKYKITIIKDGVVLDIFDNIVFVCDNVLSGQCEQKLYGSIDPTNDIPLETIQDFSYTLSEVNNTITIDFSIPSGVPSNINFLMYQSDQFGTTTLCNRTIISSAGSTSCIYNNTITDSYLDLILTRDGNVISSRTYIVQEADGVDFLDNNFFIVFIFLISIVGMAFTSPEWIIMNSVIVFVISGALWLLNGMNFVMGLGGLAWLILGAGILIFKLTKQEDR